VLSVVIPTRNRREVLLATLESLERQRAPEGGFEVVVVDNGSSDGSAAAVRELAGGSDLQLQVVEEPHGGPASARNRGVAASSGELILFLGDDTEPADPGLIASHVRLHRAAAKESYAVLGRVTWNPHQQVTPFMEWLVGRGGFQFSFNRLQAGPVSPVDAFWTAHVSLGRGLFDRAGGFDERFPYAAVEDVELGTRLERAGGVLDYHPELLVLHTHPTELSASVERFRRVGRSAALLHQIDPGWDRPELSEPSGPRWLLVRGTDPIWRALAAVGRPRRLRETAWRALHLSAYSRGYREGPPDGGASS
jgi:glycosyltransferase involved in cell wall biosynthesis